MLEIVELKSIAQDVKDLEQLDCEDIIGDVKCRFKYRSVPANGFGLTIDEVHCPAYC